MNTSIRNRCFRILHLDTVRAVRPLAFFLCMKDDIIRAMKNGELTLITFADFSKAFETVDYSIVIRKLNAI